MPKLLLTAGDILAIALVIYIGFATHGEAELSFLPRMLASFLPLTAAWFLLAPWLGLFRAETTSNAHDLWRVAPAMLFAAPFAAVVRGLILNTPVLPVFVMVLSLTSMLGMVAWRGIYLLLSRKIVG